MYSSPFDRTSHPDRFLRLTWKTLLLMVVLFILGTVAWSAFLGRGLIYSRYLERISESSVTEVPWSWPFHAVTRPSFDYGPESYALGVPPSKELLLGGFVFDSIFWLIVIYLIARFIEYQVQRARRRKKAPEEVQEH